MPTQGTTDAEQIISQFKGDLWDLRPRTIKLNKDPADPAVLFQHQFTFLNIENIVEEREMSWDDMFEMFFPRVLLEDAYGKSNHG